MLFALARGVADQADQANLTINDNLLLELANWFAEYTVVKEDRSDTETAAKFEASVEAKLPLLAKLLGSITAHFKNASTQRTEMRQKVNREINRFVERLNSFINDVRRAAKAKGKHDLVVIVDGMEKMQYREDKPGVSNFEDLYINHKEQLKAPHCHILYTVPITLAFDGSVRNAFPDNPVILPMVNQKSDDGKAALYEVVRRRLVIEEVFENPPDVAHLAEMSGGSVRDLLRLIRLACEDASDKITSVSAQNAVKRMAKDFDRALHKEDLAPLKQVAETHELEGVEAERRLLYLRMVHEYENGERWADLHPILRQVRRVRELLAPIADSQ